MKNNYITFKKYFCLLIGHKYILVKKINEHFSEFECTSCKKQVTNDSKGQKIALTSELKDINETLFYLHLKKQFVTRFYFNKKEQL